MTSAVSVRPRCQNLGLCYRVADRNARSRTVQVVVIILSASMLVSLVAMNYHFVSDVIAGSVLGGIIAMYAAYLARLQTPQL